MVLVFISFFLSVNDSNPIKFCKQFMYLRLSNKDDYIHDKIYKSERKTVQFQNKRFNTTIIDECFDAFKGRGAENIASKFKKDRSRGSAIIICTQGITELDGIPYSTKKQITDNMYFTVMFNAEDAEIKKELLAFTDFDIKQLSDIHSIEEQYIKIGRGKHGFGKIYKNRVSDLTYAIYTTDSDDVKIINYLKEKNNGSMELAIREFAELREEKNLKQIYVVLHKP